MEIEFDPSKSARNAAERGLPFDLVDGVQWDTATIEPDLRFPCPEPRFVAAGLIGHRVHVERFSPTASGGIRVIRFRKASRREVRRYEWKAKAAADR